MTTRKIFFASLLIGMLAMLTATARAQSKASVANLSQKEELRIASAAPEDTCRLSPTEAELVIGCPRNESLQMKGAWILTFTPSPGEWGPPVSSLAIFSSDGVVINTAAGATIGGSLFNKLVRLGDCHHKAFQPCVIYLPGSASPGMGAWVTQNHEFVITIAHLLYDGLGEFIGIAKVRASLKIYREAADQFSGRYVTEVFNSDGNVIETINGTVVGQRLYVELLPSNQQ